MLYRRRSSKILLVMAVAAVASCGKCQGGFWGDLEPIKGSKLSPFPPYPSDLKQAVTLAEDAVARAVAQGGRSWEGDPKGEVRSYTWDLVAMAAALHGKQRHAAAHRRVVGELIKRELPGGAWPEMKLLDGEMEDPPKPGHSESAAALALLGSLASSGLVFPGLEARLKRGQAWLERTWRPDGGLPIVPGSRRLSTEGAALAIMAGLALKVSCSWCEDRALEAAGMLTKTLWLGDHFARGLVLGKGGSEEDELDRDSTGPHTYAALAVLALGEARHALGKRAPDPAKFNPGPWLKRHFSRAAMVGGLKAHGLGGRLVLQDRSGLLYGCIGGEVASEAGRTSLVCPDSALRIAEPITCPTPYNSCGNQANAIPDGARPVEMVNAEVTLFGALMSLSLGAQKEAASLLNGALALQRWDGAVIAVAGPPRSAPDSALRYPLFHPVAQYGYTGLLVAALEGRNPILPHRSLVKAPPAGVSPPAASARRHSPIELGLLPDPATGWVAAAGPGLLHLQATTRKEGWVTWSTPFRGDLSSPLPCWKLRMTVSGKSPWDTLQIKAADSRGLTHGLNLHGLVGPTATSLELPLSRLGLIWRRPGDAGSTFRPGQFSLGVVTTGARGAPGRSILLKARGLRLVPGDCLQGSPVRFQRSEITVEGSQGKLPRLTEVEADGKRGVKISYDVSTPDAWQRVLINDRWRWNCAKAVRLRYRADQRTHIQLVLEDGQLGSGYKKGARFYVEGFLNKTDRWQEWQVGVDSLRPFNPKDLRLLDGGRLRKLAIAFPSVERSTRKGTVTLQSLEGLAPPDDLDKEGRCK